MSRPAAPAAQRRLLRGLAAAVLAAALALVPEAAPAEHPGYFPVLTIDPESLKQLIDEGRRPVAIDLRPPAAYRDGRLPGARSLPLEQVTARADEIPRQGLVVLYCACRFDQIGAAYQELRRRQWNNVLVLEEGFAGWRARGYPIER